MNRLRETLNRLTVEYWAGLDDSVELSAWANAAAENPGELHTELWQLFPTPDPERAAAILQRIALDVNGFSPTSLDAEPIAAEVLARAIGKLSAREISVPAFCQIVNRFDQVFNVELAGARQAAAPNDRERWWLGNLWNCCDWCDESWTQENCPDLLQEADRLLKELSNYSFKATSLRDAP